MTDRRILLGLAGAACLLAALWFLWDPTDGPSPAMPAGSAAEADLAPTLERASESPAPPREAEPVAAPSGASLPALHVPDYGPDLARPTARALFELRDARGQPLEGAVLEGAELWRAVGEEWVAHPVALDPTASRVACEGPGGSGLPPGDYELDLRGGPYGCVRTPFTLLAGATLERTIELPHARRVIRLELQDELGHPLPRITQAPEYTYEAPAPSWPARRVLGAPEAPVAPLVADPPAFGRLFMHSRRGWDAYYETDGGAYHVRVFAGLPAKVKLDVEKWRYGRDAIVLESDFKAPEWSAYPVVLQPVPGLHETMDAEAWVDVNPDDPGSRSLLAAPILPPPPRFDPQDVSDMLGGRIRMIVQVDTPLPVRIESESGTPHRAGGDIVDRTLWQTDDLWFMDVMLHPGGGTLPTRVGFTDDVLFFDEVPVLPVRPLPEITPEMWGKTSFEYRARLEVAPIVLDVVPPTPTLAAYARAARVEIGGPERSFEILPDRAGRFSVRSGLSPGRARDLAAGAPASVTLLGGGETGFRIDRELDEPERAALVRGAIELGKGGRGLVLRVVDGARNGVAGVTGTIAPLASGAEARAAIRSDSDGYVLLDAARLAAGERHVLLVSAPGLEDLRVDFEAAPGITDLGVVRLRAP